jgi:hypothetical protein
MHQPHPISGDEKRRRLQRVERIARSLGFVGRIEYRHEYRGTGGAQIGLAPTPDTDRLTVDARAFERDANPAEYSLQAIIAHELGHQLLHRRSHLRVFLARWPGQAAEEMMASVIGARLVDNEKDRDDLILKAVGEAMMCGVKAEDAVWLVNEIRSKLEKSS